MITVGIIFKKIDIIKSLYVFFLVATPVLVPDCKINACISESYNSDMQPNLDPKIYLEQMDSSNTGMSYELDILLFNLPNKIWN